ncbi:Aminodeoxychorismate lyase [hydrothermal vent metagenome]|uniref:aminodeoxychorismate lyase n=1 Tax=hydrothermal vent metagenome TaxID=652676 RepID=A0A3B0WJW2_9ZZZZ
MNNCLINGVATDYLTVHDRAIHYGDGLFETILWHNRKLYFWPQHYLRLKQSADKIKLACPEESLLIADIENLLSDAKSEQAYAIKVIITRGTSLRGYQFDKKPMTTRIATISAIESDYSSLLSQHLLSGDLTVCEQQVSINENLAGLKHLNRLENVLARNESTIVKNSNVVDGLMLNAHQYVIECTTSNVFSVKDKILYTPKLNQSGVQGVMRDAIIAIAKNNNINVTLSDMTIEKIKSMDEVFITNSLIGMKAINHFVDVKFSTRNVTEIIFKILLENMDSHGQVI